MAISHATHESILAEVESGDLSSVNQGGVSVTFSSAPTEVVVNVFTANGQPVSRSLGSNWDGQVDVSGTTVTATGFMLAGYKIKFDGYTT